jgi:TonB family protein
MTNRRRFAALAALLALPGCAALQPSALGAPDALLSDGPPRQMNQACRASGDPERLPSAGALVDSAAFAAAAAEAWRAAGSPAGHVLLALRYDTEGVNVRRDVIEHRVGAALADTLQKLAFAHRRRLDPAQREWSVRLRVDLGEAPRMRVGRTEVCSPRVRNGAEGGWGAAAGTTFADVRDPFAPASAAELHGASMVWVRVALDSRGNVTDARVERSLGRGMSDQRLLTYVRSIAFIPATEDGWPVPGQLSMPLRMGR